MTQGFLVGEVVRRVTGRSLADFLTDEVAGPLEADFRIVLSPEHDHRFAPNIAPPSAPDGAWVAGPPAAGRTSSPGIRLGAGNSAAFRRAEIPSGSGSGNARSVAAVQSVLACGGTARGVRLLSKESCEPARQVQYHGIDQVLGTTMRWGTGYAIFDRAIGWGGWGGSLVMVDLDTSMAVSHVMNQMLEPSGMGDHRAIAIMVAAYEGLG